MFILRLLNQRRQVFGSCTHCSSHLVTLHLVVLIELTHCLEQVSLGVVAEFGQLRFVSVECLRAEVLTFNLTHNLRELLWLVDEVAIGCFLLILDWSHLQDWLSFWHGVELSVWSREAGVIIFGVLRQALRWQRAVLLSVSIWGSLTLKHPWVKTTALFLIFYSDMLLTSF